MRYIIKRFFKAVVIIFIIGTTNSNCKLNNQNNKSVTKTLPIPVGKSIKSTDLSCEVSNIVILETSEESLIGAIQKIVFSDNGIHIMDRTQDKQIISFDNHGNFISSLSKKGRGPDEYLYPMDFVFDSDSQTLEILDNGTKSINSYGISGDFRKRTHLGFSCYSLAKNDRGSYILFLSNIDKIYKNSLLNHNLLFFDDKKGLYKQIDPFPNQNILNAFSAIPYYGFSTNRNGKLLYRHYGDPIIYTVVDDALKKEWFLDFGDQLLTEDKITNHDFNQMKFLVDYGPKSGLVYWIQDFLELEQFVFISYAQGRKVYCNLTDIENCKTIFQSESFDFLNEVLKLNTISYISNFQGMLYVAIESFDFLESPLYERLLDEDWGHIIPGLKTIKETDNPIILFYSLTK